MNFEEYQATLGHTIERFSTDGFFFKGFGFTLVEQDEFRSKLSSIGLEENVNIWIFVSPPEIDEEMTKPEWNNSDQL